MTQVNQEKLYEETYDRILEAIGKYQGKYAEEQLEKAIQAMGLNNCAINADFILKDNPNVIRLFFYAPREDCITRVKTQNGGTEKDIIRKIAILDRLGEENVQQLRSIGGDVLQDVRAMEHVVRVRAINW